MEIHIKDELSALHQFVQELLFNELSGAPGGLHVLPTGKTFSVPYELLRRRLLKIAVQQGTKIPNKGASSTHLDFSGLRILNLDEYLLNWKVIPATDPRSFRANMLPLIRALDALGFRNKNHIFPDTPYGFDYAFSGYELLTKLDTLLSAIGPASSVFLGLGPPESPHIAFCAPGYTDEIGLPWEQIGAYVSPVDAATRKANESDKGITSGDVPEYATTISPATLLLLRPQNVYLVAYGKKDLRPLLDLNPNESVNINAYPPGILSLLEAQGSSIHIVTDQATWNNATQ